MGNNIETIQGIYEAFGRGDIAAIVAKMSPDVDWDYGQTVDVPYLKPRRGRDGVAAFFQAVADHLEFRSFTPKEVFGTADGKVVIVLVDIDAIAKTTGRPIYEEDEIHLWRFGPDGLIARFRHGVDTAKHVAAHRRD